MKKLLNPVAVVLISIVIAVLLFAGAFILMGKFAGIDHVPFRVLIASSVSLVISAYICFSWLSHIRT